MKEIRRGWIVVLSTEVRQFWLSGLAPLLLLIFSLLLSIYITLLAYNPEMNVLTPLKMTNSTLQITLLIGIIFILFLNANAISGERDALSLEILLLAPLPRGQIAIGKSMATISIWLGMIPIAIPYLLLVAHGTGVENQSLVLLVTTGSMLVVLCAGIGVFISSISPSNLISYMLSFTTILLLAIPNQLPSSVKELPLISLFIAINPITAIAKYNSSLLDGAFWLKELVLLVSPLTILIVMVVLGSKILDRCLSLQGWFK